MGLLMGPERCRNGEWPKLQTLGNLRLSCWVTRDLRKKGGGLARSDTFCSLGPFGCKGAFGGLQALETLKPRLVMTCFWNLFYTWPELPLSGQEIAGLVHLSHCIAYFGALNAEGRRGCGNRNQSQASFSLLTSSPCLSATAP